MKKVLFLLLSAMLPYLCPAETKGTWEWSGDIWIRARQDLAPEFAIGKLHSADNDSIFTMSLKMRNPFVEIKAPEDSISLLIKFADGSVMKLNGRPSATEPYILPEIGTEASTRNRLYDGDIVGHIYNQSRHTNMQIVNVSYLFISSFIFHISEAETAKMASLPIVKWRMKLDGGKYLDYDINDSDAAKVNEELKKAFDKVR